MKSYFNLLTLLLTSSTIMATNIKHETVKNNLSIQQENKYKNNIDYRNVNWDFSSSTSTNNEEIKINANVDWSQWDKNVPSTKTDILSMDVKIDKTKLGNTNTFGNLMTYLNVYAHKNLDAYQPFWLSSPTQYGRSLLGVWDFTKHWELSGWQNNYWSVENYNVGIDNIILKTQLTINLDFLRIN